MTKENIMFAKGGKTQEGEIQILNALAGYNDGRNLNGILEGMSLSDYRFNKNATQAQVSTVKKNLNSLIKKGFVEEKGLGYSITKEGANYRRGNMANGGNVETALQNFDVHNLDSFEKQQYDMLFNRIGKEETLRILINNVEGDYSQLSPKLRALAKKYKLSQGITMAKGGNLANYRKANMAKGGKIKPKMVRTQFEEEEFDYGKGGAIYKGDKVKIKDSSKKMVVKDISKGRKGYVEFSGDAGTYLKGDLEKMEKGGYTMPNNCWCYEIGGL
jgi:hypothetical protein